MQSNSDLERESSVTNPCTFVRKLCGEKSNRPPGNLSVLTDAGHWCKIQANIHQLLSCLGQVLNSCKRFSLIYGRELSSRRLFDECFALHCCTSVSDLKHKRREEERGRDRKRSLVQTLWSIRRPTGPPCSGPLPLPPGSWGNIHVLRFDAFIT